MPEKVRKSGQAPEKGPGKYRRIQVSTGKGRITASVRKVEFEIVPEKGLGEYRERVESEQVPEK